MFASMRAWGAIAQSSSSRLVPTEQSAEPVASPDVGRRGVKRRVCLSGVAGDSRCVRCPVRRPGLSDGRPDQTDHWQHEDLSVCVSCATGYRARMATQEQCAMCGKASSRPSAAVQADATPSAVLAVVAAAGRRDRQATGPETRPGLPRSVASSRSNRPSPRRARNRA